LRSNESGSGPTISAGRASGGGVRAESRVRMSVAVATAAEAAMQRRATSETLPSRLCARGGLPVTGSIDALWGLARVDGELDVSGWS